MNGRPALRTFVLRKKEKSGNGEQGESQELNNYLNFPILRLKGAEREKEQQEEGGGSGKSRGRMWASCSRPLSALSLAR